MQKHLLKWTLALLSTACPLSAYADWTIVPNLKLGDKNWGRYYCWEFPDTKVQACFKFMRLTGNDVMLIIEPGADKPKEMRIGRIHAVPSSGSKIERFIPKDVDLIKTSPDAKDILVGVSDLKTKKVATAAIIDSKGKRGYLPSSGPGMVKNFVKTDFGPNPRAIKTWPDKDISAIWKKLGEDFFDKTADPKVPDIAELAREGLALEEMENLEEKWERTVSKHAMQADDWSALGRVLRKNWPLDPEKPYDPEKYEFVVGLINKMTDENLVSLEKKEAGYLAYLLKNDSRLEPKVIYRYITSATDRRVAVAAAEGLRFVSAEDPARNKIVKIIREGTSPLMKAQAEAFIKNGCLTREAEAQMK